MQPVKAIFKKEWHLSLALFTCSFLIYLFHFHYIFFNINSLLSSITLDSIKNYYTFVFHIRNDAGLLHFAGMNYPFGEHVVYTDCQPIITFVLRLFPFLHDHLIGIMHSLLFLSFMITPVILYRIFTHFNVHWSLSFFGSLAIAILSPQFLKINAGHHALAYGCVIPIAILLTLKYLETHSKINLTKLLIYLFVLFLLHPYFGLSLSLFSFLSLLFYELFHARRPAFLFRSLLALLPVAGFKVFMFLTDHHKDRTEEPYGSEVMVENLDSLIAPVFGPFSALLSRLFPDSPFHFEGHTYLGLFTIILFISILLMSPLLIRKKLVPAKIFVLFLSALLILFISFGYHTRLLKLTGIEIPALAQFRAVCRFAWIFYFMLPVFLIVIIDRAGKFYLNASQFRKIALITSLLYVGFNLLEANGMFHYNETAFWKFRNFFNSKLLTSGETGILQSIEETQTQCILPLPLFHGGSEMYERNGSSNSMAPAMMYSYHSGKPILSTMLSRTSISETENLIQLLNSYKKNRTVINDLNGKKILVLQTKDPLLPDEDRLLNDVEIFQNHDSIRYGYISQENFLKKKISGKLKEFKTGGYDDTELVYIPSKETKPFITSNMKDYEKIYVLDAGRFKPGKYVVSLHYHYALKKYQALSSNLIIAEGNENTYQWIQNINLRKLSGFYDHFGVFEDYFVVREGFRYEFIMKGLDSLEYRISNFMLRPLELTSIVVQNKDTLINNFPSK